jgi:hypothetical protein
MGMQVHFNNPEIQAKVDQWVSDTGRPAEELLEDAMAGYFEELAQVATPSTPAMTTSKAVRSSSSTGKKPLHG